MFTLEGEGQSFDGEQVVRDMATALRCATIIAAMPPEVLDKFANRDPATTGRVLAQFAAGKKLFGLGASTIAAASERLMAACKDGRAN